MNAPISTISTAYAPLLDEAERALGRLRAADADVAALLRAARSDVAEAARAAQIAEPGAAARLWERCARSETALADAVREARRRRRLDADAFGRFQSAALGARRRRSEVMSLLHCSNIA